MYWIQEFEGTVTVNKPWYGEKVYEEYKITE